MSRSNIFANIENEFENATKEQIMATAVYKFGEILQAASGFDANSLFAIQVLGAKLGVAGDGKINDQEKELIDDVFSRSYQGPIEEVYELVGAEIKESDYKAVEMLTKLGNPVAMPFLYYVLSFAYIDGVIEDEVAERLDSIFGMNLLADFFMSGAEEVPPQKAKHDGLEEKIVQWFQSDNQLRPLDDIVAHFSGHSKEEVKSTLDALVDKGILLGGAKLFGNMYGLNS